MEGVGEFQKFDDDDREDEEEEDEEQDEVMDGSSNLARIGCEGVARSLGDFS